MVNLAGLTTGFIQRQNEIREEKLAQEKERRANIDKHLEQMMADPNTDEGVKGRIGDERLTLAQMTLQKPNGDVRPYVLDPKITVPDHLLAPDQLKKQQQQQQPPVPHPSSFTLGDILGPAMAAQQKAQGQSPGQAAGFAGADYGSGAGPQLSPPPGSGSGTGSVLAPPPGGSASGSAIEPPPPDAASVTGSGGGQATPQGVTPDQPPPPLTQPNSWRRSNTDVAASQAQNARTAKLIQDQPDLTPLPAGISPEQALREASINGKPLTHDDQANLMFLAGNDAKRYGVNEQRYLEEITKAHAIDWSQMGDEKHAVESANGMFPLAAQNPHFAEDIQATFRAQKLKHDLEQNRSEIAQAKDVRDERRVNALEARTEAMVAQIGQNMKYKSSEDMSRQDMDWRYTQEFDRSVDRKDLPPMTARQSADYGHYLAERNAQLMPGLNPQATKLLTANDRMLSLSTRLRGALDEFRGSPYWNTPFTELPAAIRYKLGVAVGVDASGKTEDAVAQMQSAFSIQEWAGAAALMPNIRNSKVIEQVKTHMPQFGKDSLALMDDKERNGQDFWIDTNKAAIRWGAKSGREIKPSVMTFEPPPADKKTIPAGDYDAMLKAHPDKRSKIEAQYSRGQ